jgi:hypothetical protein
MELWDILFPLPATCGASAKTLNPEIEISTADTSKVFLRLEVIINILLNYFLLRFILYQDCPLKARPASPTTL